MFLKPRRHFLSWSLVNIARCRRHNDDSNGSGRGNYEEKAIKRKEDGKGSF